MFIQPIIYARVPTEHFTFIRTDAAARNRHLLRLPTWRARLALAAYHLARSAPVKRYEASGRPLRRSALSRVGEIAGESREYRAFN